MKSSTGCIALALGFVLAVPLAAAAQLSTPQPGVTAESESWYLNGTPINFAGTIYYPSGPVVHFNRNEMVFTGLFERVPVFKRTTQEPGSVVYVPLAGGLMKPYERRRSGDLAGTVGSAAPSFPVVLPAADVTGGTGPDFFGRTTAVIPRPVGTAGFLYGVAEPDYRPVPVATMDTSVPSPVGTAGLSPAALSTPLLSSAPARIETAQRPAGVNGVFVEFANTRWFASGPAVELDADRFSRIGDYRGFAVYEQNGNKTTIFVAAVPGEQSLIAPYQSR